MKFNCEHCAQPIEADDDFAGMEVSCPGCEGVIRIPGKPFKYWAFISYSHQDNVSARKGGAAGRVNWANWLHEWLETYRVPAEFSGRGCATGSPMPERFHPCFRDEAELPTNSDLASQIHDALDRSRFLIVIASPRSAQSRYVNEEVRYFRQLGRGDRILSIIIDGEPNVRIRPKDGWEERDDCFCPALVHPLADDGSVDESLLLAEEPIAADVRVKSGNSPRELTAREMRQGLNRQLLLHQKLKLMAALMGVGLDDLVQRDEARRFVEERARKKKVWRLVTAFSALVLVALALGLAALQQRRAAALAKEAEEAQKTLATAQVKLADEQRALASQRTAEAQTAQKMEKEAKVRHLVSLIDSARAARQEAARKLETKQDNDTFAYLARAMKDEMAVSDGLAAGDVTLPDGVKADLFESVKDCLADLKKWNHIYPAQIIRRGGHDAEFTADNRLLVTSEGDVIDVSTGKVLRTMGKDVIHHPGRISADGSRMLCFAGLNGSDSNGSVYPPGVQVWDSLSGRQLLVIQPQSEPMRRFPQAGGSRADPLQLQMPERHPGWIDNPNVAALRLHPKEHKAGINGASVSGDGKLLVTASADHSARVWDIATGRLMLSLGGEYNREKYVGPIEGFQLKRERAQNPGYKGEFLGGPLMNARFSPDQRLIVTTHTMRLGNDDWDVDFAGLWDAGNGQLVAALKLPAHGPETRQDKSFGGNGMDLPSHTSKDRVDFQFSRDGRLILAARGVNIYIWTPQGGLPGVTLQGHLDTVTSARFSPDGESVLSASQDGTARLWPIGHAENIVSEPEPDTDMFLPDGVNRYPNAPKTRPSRAQTELHPQVMRHEDVVNTAEFSPDGQRFITTSDDSTARLWIGSSPIILHGHMKATIHGKFSHDGRQLVTLCEDDAIRLWNPGFFKTPLEEAEAGQRRAPRSAGGAAGNKDGSKGAAAIPSLPPPPAWFPDFLTYLSQRSVDENRALQEVSASDWLELRQKLRAVMKDNRTKDDIYLQTLRQWVEPG